MKIGDLFTLVSPNFSNFFGNFFFVSKFVQNSGTRFTFLKDLHANE